MGHVSFMINSDITWFNNVLRDLYQIINPKSKYKTKKSSEEITSTNDNSLNINNSPNSNASITEKLNIFENGSFEGKIMFNKK